MDAAGSVLEGGEGGEGEEGDESEIHGGRGVVWLFDLRCREKSEPK